MTLEFTDIVVHLANKDILKKVYGKVKPAETLAIMGPSGNARISTVLPASK